MMFIKSPIQLRKISLLAGIFISSFSIHTGLRSKNSSTGAFAMKTEKSHFFLSFSVSFLSLFSLSLSLSNFELLCLLNRSGVFFFFANLCQGIRKG